MTDDCMRRLDAWSPDHDAGEGLRFALGELAPALRAELWWWMSQRGKLVRDPLPTDLAGLDPGADVIVDRIVEQADAEYRHADWLLAMYAVLTRFDHPHEAYFASGPRRAANPVFEAFHDIPMSADWPETLVGGAAWAIGLSRRMADA